MNANDILDMIGDAKGTYVWDAQQVRSGSINSLGQKLFGKKLWLIAAIIALILLLAGCAMVYILSLQDMAFGTRTQEYYDGSSQEVTLLSIQGIKGSAGYQATKEWYEWLETYDTDMVVYYSEEAFSEDFGDEYYAYNLYSREMKDKLDDICAKYGLELLGKMYVDPDIKAGCKALQISEIFRPNTQAEADWGNLRYYANGSFAVEGDVTLPGGDTHIVLFRCQRKDVFSDLYGSIGPEGTYEEWIYTTSYGVDVLMLIETGGVRGHAQMIVDRGPYVFLFSVHEFENMPLLDKAGLEAYAEVFDFTMEPQRVSQEDLKKAEARLKAAEEDVTAEDSYYIGFRISPEGVWYPPEGYSNSFEGYIAYIQENASQETQFYTLLDIDGDGAQELLWGSQDGELREVAVMHEGQVTLRFDDCLCAGNVLMDVVKDAVYNGEDTGIKGSCIVYEYDTIEENLVTLIHLTEAEQWVVRWPEQKDQVITEAEAKKIMDQYAPIPLDMKPISEFVSS